MRLPCAPSLAIFLPFYDCSPAIFVSCGTVPGEIVLPEYEVVVVLQPGDLMTFWPQSMYHGLSNNPCFCPQKPGVVLMSMYNNAAQFAKWSMVDE